MLPRSQLHPLKAQPQPCRPRPRRLLYACRALTQSEEARRLTAYHESGHALVALYTEGALPIHKASCPPGSFPPVGPMWN